MQKREIITVLRSNSLTLAAAAHSLCCSCSVHG